MIIIEALLEMKGFLMVCLMVLIFQFADAQKCFLEFEPQVDTVHFEMTRYSSTPSFRHSSFKIKTDIECVWQKLDKGYSVQWKINESKAYDWKEMLNASPNEVQYMNFLSHLTLDLFISERGEYIQLDNLQELNDSIALRMSNTFGVDDFPDSVFSDDSTSTYGGPELLEYFKSANFDEDVFMNIYFPEVIEYFAVNDISLELFSPKKRPYEASFAAFSLHEIDVEKNIEFVRDESDYWYIENQIELTNQGCTAILKQLKEKAIHLKGKSLEHLSDFDCNRIRLIQEYKYNKQDKLMDYYYQKHTFTVNDEPYYYWLSLQRK